MQNLKVGAHKIGDIVVDAKLRRTLLMDIVKGEPAALRAVAESYVCSSCEETGNINAKCAVAGANRSVARNLDHFDW